MGWRRVWARRRTEFHDADGVIVAWVHIDWVLLDGRGAPTRIPKEFDAVFGAPQATFGLARVDLGEVPPEPARSTVTVRPQELDPMDHVNNAVYADWLDETLLVGPAGRPRRASRAWCGSSTPGRPSQAPELVVDTWPDGGVGLPGRRRRRLRPAARAPPADPTPSRPASAPLDDPDGGE